MIEILKSVLFGIVEGITEWLPISSTGHMILLNDCLLYTSGPEQPEKGRCRKGPKGKRACSCLLYTSRCV